MNNFLVSLQVGAFIALLVPAQCAKIPSYIKLCERDDPEIANCIKNSIYSLVPHLRNGIKELNVPPIDPFEVSRTVTIKFGGPGSAPTNVSDLTISGTSEFEILEIKVSTQKHYIRFKVNFPFLRLVAKYEIDAKILFLELKGEGPLYMNVTNYLTECVLQGHKESRNNIEYLKFDKMTCTADVSNVKIHLDNLFQGNEELSKATETVINDNYYVFFEEMRPDIIDAINTEVLYDANQIVSQFPYDSLFP